MMQQTDSVLVLVVLGAAAAGCIALYLGRRLLRRTLQGVTPWLLAIAFLLTFLALFAIALDFTANRGADDGMDRGRQRQAAEDLAASVATGGRVELRWLGAEAMLQLRSGRSVVRIDMRDPQVTATLEDALVTIFGEIDPERRVVALDEHSRVPPAPVLGLVEQVFRRRTVRLTVRPFVGGEKS